MIYPNLKISYSSLIVKHTDSCKGHLKTLPQESQFAYRDEFYRPLCNGEEKGHLVNRSSHERIHYYELSTGEIIYYQLMIPPIPQPNSTAMICILVVIPKPYIDSFKKGTFFRISLEKLALIASPIRVFMGTYKLGIFILSLIAAIIDFIY